MSTQTRIEPVPRDPQVSQWSPATRVAFRFCFAYFGLFCLTTQIFPCLFPIPKVDIPDLGKLWPMRQITMWSAAHIFRVAKPLVYTGSGSGDKTFDWVLAFCVLVFAGLVTGVWSLWDRKRENYGKMHQWFRLAIRFCLAGQMLVYGLDKAIPLQMPFPVLEKLIEPFGNFSPMGVLWSSIGASPAYEIFAGCAELAGGLLLIVPRTATIGALVCLVDMIQVFALNMTYDVPVKLFSFHLILLALFLLAPESRRLINFFFLNRAVEPSPQAQLFRTRRGNRRVVAAQILFGLWLVGMNAYGSRESWYTYGGGRPKSPLYGIWEVSQLSIDGQLRSPELTEPQRWRRAIFDFPNGVAFQRTDDSIIRYGTAINVNDKTLTLTKGAGQKWANFKFQREPQDRLTLDGEMDSHKTHVQLQLVDYRKFVLTSRGFHWIQEYPFNR